MEALLLEGQGFPGALGFNEIPGQVPELLQEGTVRRAIVGGLVPHAQHRGDGSPPEDRDEQGPCEGAGPWRPVVADHGQPLAQAFVQASGGI